MVDRVSESAYGETLQRLLDALSSRGLTVFAQIDHAAGARAAGMELADEIVVVFGSARAGTPLMQQDPRVGIELPLRMLIWMRGDAAIVSYNDPRDLARTYDLGSQTPTLEAMASLLAEIAHEAAVSRAA